MELHNKVASRRPWPLFAARGGWLRIPAGWTTLLLAVIFVVL
jgi:hypothetical protein